MSSEARRASEGIRIAVLASGSGTNLQAIIDACRSGFIPGRVSVVISDRKEAFALERARRAGIKAIFLDPKNYASRQEFDRAMADIIARHECDLVAMAGYMRLLSPEFIRDHYLRVMNIHPALCPSFPGMHAIRDALAYGVKVTGVTVHFADEGTDTGPVILQYPVFVRDGDTEDTLAERVHAVEHKLYPLAIKLFAEGKLRCEGRLVRILDPVWETIIERGELTW